MRLSLSLHIGQRWLVGSGVGKGIELSFFDDGVSGLPDNGVSGISEKSCTQFGELVVRVWWMNDFVD